MFAYITGNLAYKEPTECVIDVQGIGYEIQITLNTFEQLPEVGKRVSLRTHFHVREDAQKLFGFHNKSFEKEMFLLLIGISGIGPKMALTILSGATPKQFQDKISAGDVKSLTLIPGIGKKTAQRIIMELSEKLVTNSDENIGGIATSKPSTSKVDEALRALMSLGYSQTDAAKATGKAARELGEDGTVEQYIKSALNKF